jgi:hypothetical protein
VQLGRELGFHYLANGTFVTDLEIVQPLPAAAVVLVSQLSPVTFTCVPPGSGVRAGIDRDLDGALDGDELLHGTDPADPSSKP